MASEDLKAARIMVAECFFVDGDPEVLSQRVATAITAARAEQREGLARVCDQRADQASINETEFDSLGERDLLPSVKFWEGQRVALQEFAAAIRAGKE